MIQQHDICQNSSFNTQAVASAAISDAEFKSDGWGFAASEENIYEGLATHQRSEAWHSREFIGWLQTWTSRFNAEFNLGLTEIALRVDVLSRTCYGHFRWGHNGFGLKGEIAINRRYLTDRPPFQVLGTLLHELLHAWQHAHGTPSRRDHHNEEFREKARACGLLIDRRGVTGFAAASRFKDLLRGYAIAVPDSEFIPTEARQKGNSKLKKWSCECTNVRCAVADLRARCLKCGAMFVQE
jgi:predicted SprT family Zn-dependent metalloprotease